MDKEIYSSEDGRFKIYREIKKFTSRNSTTYLPGRITALIDGIQAKNKEEFLKELKKAGFELPPHIALILTK